MRARIPPRFGSRRGDRALVYNSPPMDHTPEMTARGNGATGGWDTELAVLVVDDQVAVSTAVARILTYKGYHCRAAEGAEEALRLLDERGAAVVISDINMPVHDGLWLLERLRSSYQDTAVIMLTGFAEVDTAVQCLREGASDFLTKPVRAPHLLTSVERALERRRLVRENREYQHTLEVRIEEATCELRQTYRELSRAYQLTLEALSSALDAREEETADHSRRVTIYSLSLADQLGIEGEEREHLARGAILHDIGKIGVPDHILLKPAALTEEEWAVMKRHPVVGHRILSGIPFLAPTAQIVLTHHEHFNGNGYPQGLKEEQIPIGARIFSVADAFDAITSDRPYRKANTIEAAVAEIVRWSGRQFDPKVVDALERIGLKRLTEIYAHPQRAS